MSLTASSLRDLHRIHQQQADLNDRLAAGPIRVNAAEAAVQQLQITFDGVKDNYTQARVHTDGQQLQLQEREQRISDTRGKLNTCSTNKEFQTLKDQIDTDLEDNDLLADQILELLEGLDEHENSVNASQEGLNKANQELEKIRQAVEAAQTGLENDLQRIQDELEKAEAALPGDLRTDYRRIAKAMGEDALAGVDADVCGGCFQTLTPQTINELLMSKPVFCKSCGRLLYMAGETDSETDE